MSITNKLIEYHYFDLKGRSFSGNIAIYYVNHSVRALQYIINNINI